MLVEERVVWEGVVRDVGDPLEGPLFRIPELGGGVGNLGDVSHSGDYPLNVEVRADGRGERGVGYEIGALNVFFEGGGGPMTRRSLLWDQ